MEENGRIDMSRPTVEMKNIVKMFGSFKANDGINLTVHKGEIHAILGENGAGKSTLLNIIVGDMDYDSGTIARGSGKRIGFLRQDSGLALGGTIISEMRSVFALVLKSEERLHELEHRMASLEHGSGEYAELSAEYEHEKSRFEAADGYNINVKINTVLTGMGFSSFDPETPVERLSGGEADSCGDHRIAMLCACAAPFCTGPVVLRNAGCTAKSYPGFWADYRRLGGQFEVL